MERNTGFLRASSSSSKIDLYAAALLREEEKIRRNIRAVKSDDEWDSFVADSKQHCGAFVFFRKDVKECPACGFISPKFYQLPDVALGEVDAPKLLFVEVNVSQ